MSRYIIQMRRGTAEQWANSDIKPLAGELVVEIDEVNNLHKLKIGDGEHIYSELAYLQAGDELVTQVLAKALPRAVTVELPMNKWQEVTCATDPKLGYYGQVVEIEGTTEYSRLDLQPNADILAEFQSLDLAFVTENNKGTITVYSIGDLPSKDYSIQATIVETEVLIDDPIVGISVSTPTTTKDILRYTEQTLTEEQKTQARLNIGAGNSNFSGNYDDLTNKPAIPDSLSDLTTDSTHRTVTDAEKTAWNAKSNFSGNYNDLTNKPTTLKNPKALTFTGASSVIYDGASEETINIPSLDNYYNKSEVESRIATASHLKKEIVTSLPTHEDINSDIIYLVPKTTSGTQNVYNEYMYINDKWEKIGDTEIDLTNYAKTSDIPETLPNPYTITFRNLDTNETVATYDGSQATIVNFPKAPTSLPNPNALTFTGVVSETYDGSSAKTINIPEGTFYVTIQGTDETYTADKTYAEITEAYNNGQTVFARMLSDETGNVLLPMVLNYEGEGLAFGAIAGADGIAVLYMADGLIQVTSQTYATQEEIPSLDGYATISDVESRIATASHLKKEIVDVLPELSESAAALMSNTIFLVPRTTAGNKNIYDEYMILNNKWEKIGDTEIDLTNYAKKSDIPTKLPNPNVLTFTGAVTGSYDGSSNETINIPTIAGEKGEDGIGISSVKQTTNSFVDGGANQMTVTLSNGTTSTFTVLNGSKGSTGDKGETGATGVGISSVKQTTTSTADGGTNIVTVTLSNGTTSTFNVKNGSKGSTGDKGKTPVKGTDYWTSADKAEIIQEVTNSIENIPSYVATEAENVISRVLSAQGNRTFTFACINDMHYGNSSYTDGVQNAVKAMKYIDERIKLDAVMVLGDYVDSCPADALEDSIADFKAINKALTDLRFAPNIRTQGNHDFYENNAPINRRFIQAYTDNAVWGSKSGGYFYRDFEDFKLRVIAINTTETSNANIGVSLDQYNWFVDALDLTNKSDVSEWQILVVSHHPLDWYVADSTYRFGYILNAYKNGTSWSGGNVSCDYSGKNQATLIGCLHGHIHNFLVDYIHKGNIVNADKTEVLRLCNPEACIDRANHYGGEWSESTSYPKTKNSKNDTAFCIYCIDLDAYTINAICYGAGYDRAIDYVGNTIYYTITNNLSGVYNDNTATNIEAGGLYVANLTTSDGTTPNVSVTMGGVDITSNVYANNIINISPVTGNIIITATAGSDSGSTASYTNLIPTAIDTDGSVYNGKGYMDDTRLNSSGVTVEAAGIQVTGFMSLKGGYNGVIYCKGLKAGPDDSISNYCYIRMYNANFEHLHGCMLKQVSGHSYLFPNYTTDENGYITSMAFALYQDSATDPVYFRLSAPDIGSAVITVNEPIDGNTMWLAFEKGQLDFDSGELYAKGSNAYFYSNETKVESNKTYTLNIVSGLNTIGYVFYYDASGNFISRTSQLWTSTPTTESSFLLDVPSNAATMKVLLYNSVTDNVDTEIKAANNKGIYITIS